MLIEKAYFPLKNFGLLLEKERSFTDECIFKRWMEIEDRSAGHSDYFTVLSEEEHENLINRGRMLENQRNVKQRELEKLRVVDAKLNDEGAGAFLKDVYEWWYEIHSFGEEVRLLLTIMKEIEHRQVFFSKASDYLAPCFDHMQNHTMVKKDVHEPFIKEMKEREVMGLELSPLAKEFLFTVPFIEENATPLTFIDPTFCLWERSTEKMKDLSRYHLEMSYMFTKKMFN